MFAGFTHEPAVRLAARLTALLPAPLTRVFYSDDGSTSVEVALKLALEYGRKGGQPRHRRLAVEGGYHGDTSGPRGVARGRGFYTPFQDKLFAVDFIPSPATWIDDPDVAATEARSLAALDRWLADHGSEAAAFIAEPLVQGAAGMRMCRPAFLQEAAKRARAAGLLVIFDEVMTGFGRTGTNFACDAAGIAPDLICLSKGLTGGFLPLAATVCTDQIHDAFLDAGFEKAFAHGHSYTANPLGCAAALASLDLLEAPETATRIRRIGAAHAAGLSQLSNCAALTRRRQTGTIAAVTLPATDAGYSAAIGPRAAGYFLERGLLVRPIGNELYFLPPYCVTDEEIAAAYRTAADFARTLR